MTLSVQLATPNELVSVTERVTEFTATDPMGNTRTFAQPYVPPIFALLNSARINIDFRDQIADGGVSPNIGQPTPTANLVPFPTGLIVDEAPDANVMLENYSADIDGGAGDANATLIETDAANQSFYILRIPFFDPALANGPLSVRFRARSFAGKGSQTIDCLFPGANFIAETITETAQDFEYDLTYAGSGDLNIRIDDSGAKFYIDRLQVHECALIDMPDWSEEVQGGGRRAIAHATSMPTDAAGGIDLTGQGSGLIAIDPAFPAKHDYDAYTVMLASSADAIPTAGAQLVNYNAGDGAGSTDDAVIIDSTSPYQGEYNASAGSSSRQKQAANLAGEGVVITGQGRSATHRSTFLDTARAFHEELAFAGISTARWNIHSWSTNAVANYTNNFVAGTVFGFRVWDYLLTDEEWAIAANELKASLIADSVTMAPVNDYHVISGDSNGTRGTGDWTQLITADGYMTGDNLIASITSVGGKGLPDLERNFTDGELGTDLTVDTITENGRFNKTDKPILTSAAADGKFVLYGLPLGTNDGDVMEDYPGTVEEQADAYTARLQTFILYVLDNVPANVDVMWYSLKPYDPTARPDFEAHRGFVNADMAAWIATQPRVYLCDTGGSATLGDPANFATYYNADRIHFIAAGDTEKASIARTAIETWRTAKGL